MDAGITTPAEAPFSPEFTEAPQRDRYAGADSLPAATASLRLSDSALTERSRTSQEEAYRGRLAQGARLHRAGALPYMGTTEALAYLRTQPAYRGGGTRFAEVSTSRGFGYTWGRYAVPASAVSTAAAEQLEEGFYVRVWVRGRDGAWKVVLDVLRAQ